MEKFEVHISGFKTKQQAEAFAEWYEGQGEQSACVWFECREDLGCSSMLTDMQKSKLVCDKDGIVHLVIKPEE